MWKIRRGYWIVLSVVTIIAIVNILQVDSAKRVVTKDSDERFIRETNIWLEEQQRTQEILLQMKSQNSSWPAANDTRAHSVEK